MKENKDNKDNTWYLEDGSEVALICQVNDGKDVGYVVRAAYKDGFRGILRIVNKAFPSPPHSVFDAKILELKEEIKDLQTKKEQATAAYLASELEYGELLAKLKSKAVIFWPGGKS